MRRLVLSALAGLLLSTFLPAKAGATGARLFKSGPVQVTADGRHAWIANADQDTVTRFDTVARAITEYPLPAGAKHLPRGLSVSEDGREVWVACHDSDQVLVLDGASGSVLASIPTGWGSGPYSVALSRDQGRALVTLHRAAALAVIDVASRTITHRLEPVFWSPLGITWLQDGTTAWVSHLFADGEDPFLTRIDFSGPQPKVLTRLIVKSTNPKRSSALAAPHDIAEGGYLTFRGHLAQLPVASNPGPPRVWMPTQYNNINEDIFSPDSTVQSTIRQLDVAAHLIPNANADKVILTAVHVHDPAGANPYVGPGWDAHVSGPVDLGFSADGATAWVLFEQSDDLLVMPTALPAANMTGAPRLTEIPLGSRPLGLAVSPVRDEAYAWNSLDSTLSVVDLAANAVVATIPLTAQPALPTPQLLNGARLFHASQELGSTGPDRISVNQKVACASCHPHGEHDGRIWDFENLPGNHGPRSSMSLLGLSQTYRPVTPGQRGQLHRSGDRDEIQDFDFTFTSPLMGGTGYLGIAPNPELGPPNAGISADLDDLDAYVMSLTHVPRSPHRDATGALSEAALRGATFFVGSGRGSADAACATCHVPETGFVDFQFHDVGQRRPASENELNLLNWTVNTPTLVGVWTTPPYDGVSTYASTILGVIQDAAGRATHGRTSGLTGRQKRDLAEFVMSIDGNTTATEVRAARDVDPPRVERVSVTSLTRIDIWFNESVDPSAASPAAWRVSRVGGGDVPITSATWDGQNGDRITLFVDSLQGGCANGTFDVVPLGPIMDMADRAGFGTANALDILDPSNSRRITLGDRLTITMGASGYENITVGVHDAAVVGPNLGGWSHGSPWLGVSANGSHSGFVRFDWASAFQAATAAQGTASTDILDARFALHPEWGDVQDVEALRVLKSWLDNGHGDWASNPNGAPTWSNAGAGRPWGTANAMRRAAGVEGRVAGDYNGANDTAFTPDVVATMQAINEPFWIGGPMITDAYRFWFDNPTLDYGHCIRIVPRGAPGSYYHEAKFENGNAVLRQHSPVLEITYALPSVPTTPPGEVSGPATGIPLHVFTDPSGLRFSFENLNTPFYSVYEGRVRALTAQPADWYSHAGASCAMAPTFVGAVRSELIHVPSATSPGNGLYFLVTATDGCTEGPSGADSRGTPHPAARLDCAP